MAAQLPLAAVVPFIALLGAIAVCPPAFLHWWEHSRNKAASPRRLSEGGGGTR